MLSCKKMTIEQEESNDPENTFTIFWTEINEQYAIFEYKNVDWQHEYDINRPLVTPNTTEDELWDILTGMIAKLDDIHTFIHDVDAGLAFVSGSAAREHAIDEFSLDLVKIKYLENVKKGDYDKITHGRIVGENIGYIHWASMLGEDATEIQTILQTFKNTDGVIVDVRNNGGGNSDYSDACAGYFSDGVHAVYKAAFKNGPGRHDFGPFHMHYTIKADGFRYLKPVVVITDRKSVSAAESFTLNMKTFAHVYHIGDNTAGALSHLSPIKILPNGWSYAMSYQNLLTPDGVNLESIGVSPDHHITNSANDIANDTDMVLEYAIGYLN